MVFFLSASLLFAWNSWRRQSLPNIDPSLFEGFNRLLLATHHLPAVLVDLDAFDANVSLVREQLSQHPQTSIRIASKSLRVPFLLQRILDSGGPYKGLMCFAVEEAEFLASLGFDDLLIAYPSQQELDYAILRDLHETQKKTVSIVVDCPKGIEDLNRVMNGVTQPFPVILEFDASFRTLNGRVHVGARRSPIRTLDHLSELISLIEGLPFLRLEGLMVYESHVAGIGDSNPMNFWLNPLIRAVKRASIPQIQHWRREMAELCRKHRLKIFNGGGTGSLTSALTESAVLTEITIGSGFFQPHLFDHYDQNHSMLATNGKTFLPSCYFALATVRTSDEGEWVTCSGGGYVASGRPGWDKVPLPVFPVGLTLDDSEGPGEVQTPLKIAAEHKEEIRQTLAEHGIVYFRHAKGGEIAERFLQFLLVSKGQLLDSVKTYRGYGKCFF